jgi:hypothetical protein
MNIKEVMRQISEELGFEESVIRDGFRFADSIAGQGQDVKKLLDKELTEEEVTEFTKYIKAAFFLAITDPDFKRSFLESGSKLAEGN